MLPRIAAVAVAALASLASAQMFGQTLTAEWQVGGPDFVIESHQIVVSNEYELTPDNIINDTKFTIDLTDDRVSFAFNHESYWTTGPFNGWYFADTNDALPDIIGYHIWSFTGTGNPVFTTGWNDNAFWANFEESHFFDGDVITFEVIFVPAPSTACLALIGLAALRRRR